MIDGASRGLDDEGAPERHAMIPKPPGRPVIGGLQMHREASIEGHARAPVMGLRIDVAIRPPHDPVIAQRRDDARRVPSRQRGQGRHVQMVVMVVADEHRVELRQILEGDARRVHPLGSRPWHGAGALGPDGIDEDVEPLGLDEEGGVAHQRHAQGLALDAGGGMIVKGARRMSGPGRALAPGHPAQQLAPRLVAGDAANEKTGSIEMVGLRAGVIGVARHGPEVA